MNTRSGNAGGNNNNGNGGNNSGNGNGQVDPNMVNFFQTLTQTLAGIGQAVAGITQAPLPAPLRDPLELFQRRNPDSFSDKAKDWIKNTERIFETLTCTEEQKVTFETFMLKGKARSWWEAEKRAAMARGDPAITWDTFKTMFHEKYYPTSLRNERVAEFLTLTQGSRTVAEYGEKFTDLLEFAPQFFDNEEQKSRKFEAGLSDRIKYRITPLALATYSAVLDRAKIVEKESDNYRSH